MKKYRFGCLGIIIIVLTTIGYIIYSFFFSLSNLPKGEFIKQIDSPNHEYTLNFYLINGGATTSYAIRGELADKQPYKKKNIYWDYKIQDVEVFWIDDTFVIINGHKLNIKKDTYDWRRK